MRVTVQPFEVDDFSGGITDNYVDAPVNRYETADNLLLLPYGQKAKLITRPGSVVLDASAPQLPTGNQRIGELIAFDNDSTLFAQTGKELYYLSGGAWTELAGPTSGDVFPAGSTTSNIAFAQWNKHLLLLSDEYVSPQKVYKDGGGVLRCRNMGLPVFASSPGVSIATAGTTYSYVYSFVYSFEYTVGSVNFEDQGATTLVTATSGAVISGGNAASITGIPVMAASENWDTVNVKVKIYRSKANGTTLRYVDTVSNGTTTYSDTTSDATLSARAPIYTTGGVLDNDLPPKSKVIHVVDGYCLYGNIKEGVSTVYANRLMQSVKDDPDSVPAEFLLEFEEDIVGISSFQSTPVVFTKRNVYRTEGFWDEQGRGGMRYVRISDVTGAVNHQSIVQTNAGVFFAGSDGFYWTDAFKVMKITKDLNATYKSLIETDAQKKRIRGDFDKKNRRLWWAVQSDSSGSDVDKCFVLDLNFAMNEQMPFTTASGGTSFVPTAVRFYNDDLIRADKRGFVFRHHDDYLSDPRITPGGSPTILGQNAVVYDFKSAAINFGSNLVRKWVPWGTITADNVTNLSLQIRSINDDHRSTKDLEPIRFRLNMVWGEPEVLWGDEDLVWNYDGLIERKMRFPAGGLRCSYKQVEFTNAHVVVSKSDNLGDAAIDAFNKTSVLVDAPTVEWPEQCLDMYLSVEDDAYVREYKILTRTDDTLTLEDPSATLPTGTRKWVIRGMPKNERLHLLSYVLHFAPLTPTQEVFRQASLGGND